MSSASWKNFKGIMPTSDKDEQESDIHISIDYYFWQRNDDVAKATELVNTLENSVFETKFRTKPSIYSKPEKIILDVWNSIKNLKREMIQQRPGLSQFSSRKDLKLNEVQKFAINYAFTILNSGKQLKLLLHGGPGTGNSPTINELISIVGLNNVVCCPPT